MITVSELSLPPDDFMADQADDAVFYRAFCQGCLPGFTHGFFRVERDGSHVATLPWFTTDFQLNTMLPEGWLKSALGWLKIPMACIGHPVADLGRVDGTLDTEITAAITEALKKKGKLITWKGFGADLPLSGYTRVLGLPETILSLNGDYYGSLKGGPRRKLTRRLRKAAALRYVVYHGLPADQLDRLYALYLQTWQKAPIKFGCVTRDYFTVTSARSTYLLFYRDDLLIGFVQVLGHGAAKSGMFLGMDYACNHEYGLYFAMIIRTIEAAQDMGCTELALGSTSYSFKRSLGAAEHPTWNYFFHQSPFINKLLSLLRGVLEPSEEELK